MRDNVTLGNDGGLDLWITALNLEDHLSSLVENARAKTCQIHHKKWLDER